MLYSLDPGLVFDPVDLGEDVTEASVHSALSQGAMARALSLALRLRDAKLLQQALLATPPADVSSCCHDTEPGTGARAAHLVKRCSLCMGCAKAHVARLAHCVNANACIAEQPPA